MAVKGLSQLDDTLSTSTTTAATARLLSEVYNNLTNAASKIAGKMPREFFDFIKLSGSIFSSTNFVVTLAGGLTFYADGIKFTTTQAIFDLTTLYPMVYKNKTYFAYIELVTDANDDQSVQYTISTVKTDDTDTKTCIGSFDTNSTEVMSSTITGFTRVLHLSELLEHIQSTTAHGLSDIDLKTRIGLNDMSNFGVNDVGADTNEYVSLAGINALRTAINNKVIITKGMIASGSYIPLPAGSSIS